MCDSWLQVHGEPDPEYFDMSHVTPDSYTQFFGFTCNSPFNTFSRYHKDNGFYYARQLMGKRLDYIFYRYSPQMECVSSRVILTENIPDTDMSYSDHFGVLSIFKIASETTQLDTMAPSKSLIAHPNYTHLSLAMIDDILDAIETDRKRAKKSSNALISYFFVLTLLCILLYVIVVALPSTLSKFGQLPVILVTVFGGFLLTLITLLIPICLIVGFVFGHTEHRTLQQFYNEIETFKNNRVQ